MIRNLRRIQPPQHADVGHLERPTHRAGAHLPLLLHRTGNTGHRRLPAKPRDEPSDTGYHRADRDHPSYEWRYPRQRQPAAVA